MKIHLIIPGKETQELLLQTDHPQSSYNLGVIIYSTSKEILDGLSFRYLHTTQNAIIKTDHPQKVCHALGVPLDEPGIIVI